MGFNLRAKKLLLVILGLASITMPSYAYSSENLNLMRRWVVFPYDADSLSLKNSAENAWWKTREKLTAGKKYLVASRQFLIQKDVFQARRDLNPDDITLLAHLLDADVLVTGYSENREFQLNVYLGQNGKLFWSKRLSFHPSLKATDQLELISAKLTGELLSQIPYQGFVVTDPIIGKTVYTEGNKKFAVVDTGLTDQVEEGMDVQFVQVLLPDRKDSNDKKDSKEGVPLLSQSKIQVLGEGKVSKIKRGVFVAEIERVKSLDMITEKTMVVIPKLAIKLGESYVGAEVSKEKNSPEVLPMMINPVAPESRGAHKQTLIFGSVLSVIGLLLLGL